MRRTFAKRRGQLWLSDELEFAPVPFALWPARAVQHLQMPLFDDSVRPARGC